VKKISLLALLLIVVGVIGSIITYSLSDQTAVAEEREVDVTNIENIEIQMDNGSVNVFPADTDQAEVEMEGIVSEGTEPNFIVETEGGTLTIEIKEKRRFIQLIPLMGSPSLHLYLPEKEYASLHADINNGIFQAEDLAVKEIQAESDNGKIVLTKITAEAAEVRTSNGKIEMNMVEGDITGKSNNGAISVETVNLDRDLDLETDNGSITIQTENEPSNAIIDARTDNGRVTVFGHSDWDTMIGDGENEIRLRTNNGRITIEK
jgi:DUF4097 and DUF4098 domain-containing protein YvlB